MSQAKPMIQASLENKFLAIKLATEVIGHWADDKRISIAELDPDLSEVVAAFTPVYRRHGDGREILIGYDLNISDPKRIDELFSSVKRAHEHILAIAKMNILLGHPIPEPLRPLVVQKLETGGSTPSDGGLRNVRERNILFVMLAERMNEDFHIARHSPTKFSATQAIWAACMEFNVVTTESQVGKVIRENNDLRAFYVTHPHLLGSRSAVVDALLGRPHIPTFTPQPSAFRNALVRLGHTPEDYSLN